MYQYLEIQQNKVDRIIGTVNGELTSSVISWVYLEIFVAGLSTVK